MNCGDGLHGILDVRGQGRAFFRQFTISLIWRDGNASEVETVPSILAQ
jgi:hypothetical protein